MVTVSWGNWSLLAVRSGMSPSLEILSVPPSWYLLSSSSLYLLTHPSCGLSIPLLDSCSIFLTSCSLKVLPAMSLLDAQGDLPKMKHCYVCLAGTEVCDEDTFPCLWPFMLNTAMFPLSSSLTHCLLPLSCAIVATHSGITSNKWWVFLSREGLAPPQASAFPWWLSPGSLSECAWSPSLQVCSRLFWSDLYLLRIKIILPLPSQAPH